MKIQPLCTALTTQLTWVRPPSRDTTMSLLSKVLIPEPLGSRCTFSSTHTHKLGFSHWANVAHCTAVIQFLSQCPKPSLKVGTANAICWNYLGLFPTDGALPSQFSRKVLRKHTSKSQNFQLVSLIAVWISLKRYFCHSFIHSCIHLALITFQILLGEDCYQLLELT